MTDKDLKDIHHFSKIIEDIKFAMFTTQDLENGALVSRPMTLQQMEFDGALWFFAGRNSELINQIENNPQVNLAFSNPKNFSFLSACGRAHVVFDREKARELWNPLYKAWFPEGLDDPNLCLLKVEIETADFWESPDSSIVKLVGFAKAILSGNRSQPAVSKQGRLEIN